MSDQMSIFDYEYGVLRRTLAILEAAKIANTSAYRDNIYWHMGFDCAMNVIKRELERGENGGAE